MTIEYTDVNYSEGFGYLAEVERAKNRVSEEAEATRRALITALTQRLDRGHKQKLEACSSNLAEPCNWSICPVCVERTQRLLIAEVAAWVDHLSSEGELPIVAVAADFPGQRYEQVIDINLGSLNRKIQRRYTEARFPLAVSGVQISVSQDDRTEADVWEASVCSVIVGLRKREVLKRISTLYPGQSLRRWRPNLDAETALRSTMRTGYFRQVTHRRSNGFKVTGFKGLPGRELRQLWNWFGQYKMTERFVLTGCRLTNGEIELDRGVEERLKKSARSRSRRRD